jgi:hypothetical protein
MKIIKLMPSLSDERASYFLGQVPYWLADESRPARDLINEGYRFGGWQPLKGATIGEGFTLCYPGDPPQHPFAKIERANGEVVYAYPHEFWAIVTPQGVEFAGLD